MIIGIILHIVFGAFLSAMLWFFGLGGMTAWFYGKETWLGSPVGGSIVIGAGVLVGYAAYIFRDHDFIARSPENAERFHLAKVIFFAIISACMLLLLVVLKYK
jgi:hypothetical protein